MARITIEYDAKNSMAKKMIDFLLSLDFVKVKQEKEDESTYDKEFMKEIEQSFKSEGKAIKVEDLWK